MSLRPDVPDPALSRAVVIGTADFGHQELTALPAVRNNVADVGAALRSPEIWGLPDAHVVTCLNPREAKDVLAPVEQAAAAAQDTLLVYYAGHGVLTRDGALTLSTTGTEPGRAEYTAAAYAHLRDIVTLAKARRRVVILDCCYSGRATRAMSDRMSAVIGQVDVDGCFVLTSSPANEPSKAPEGERNTAFTAGLLTVLRDGVAGAGPFLSLDDIYVAVLQLMARNGFPRPTSLGANLLGRLALLRNRAAGRRDDDGHADEGQRGHKDLAPVRAADRVLAGQVAAAASVAARGYGRRGHDGLAALEASVGGAPDPGAALVIETMRAMRDGYGDGAVTSALMLARLVSRLDDAAASGHEPARLAAVLAALAPSLAVLVGRTPVVGPADGTSTATVRAVRAALGDDELVASIVDPCLVLGAENVEVAAENDVHAGGQTFTFASRILSPNGSRGPISLVNPLVVISVDGTVDLPAVVGGLGDSRRGVLVIAPKVAVSTARAVLRRTPHLVVVRPLDPGTDLLQLRDRWAAAGGGSFGTARRALVLEGVTTVEQPSTALDVAEQRRVVRISDATPVRLERGSRALAVARAAARDGVVDTPARALAQAAEAVLEGTEVEAAPPAQAAVLMALAEALRAPAEELERSATTALVDTAVPLDQLRGLVTQVAASGGRFLGLSGRSGQG